MGTILHTSDGGETWEHQDSGSLDPFVDIYFIDSQRGWAVGFGPIAHTEDGGKTWVCQNNDTGTVLWSVHFNTPLNGWAVGANGVIIRSEDGGKSWAPQTSGTKNWIFDMCSAGDQLWAVGLKGMILKYAEDKTL